MIPVFDMAKANPRIPLPIMALLRLKMDMPNEVFPSNCRESTTEDVTQINHFMNQKFHSISGSFHRHRANTHVCKVEFFLGAGFMREKLLLFGQIIKPTAHSKG